MKPSSVQICIEIRKISPPTYFNTRQTYVNRQTISLFLVAELQKYTRYRLKSFLNMIYDLSSSLPGKINQPGWFNHAMVAPYSKYGIEKAH